MLGGLYPHARETVRTLVRRRRESARLLGALVLCGVLGACTAESGTRVVLNAPAPAADRKHHGQSPPDQRWGSADFDQHVVDGPANRTVPQSLRGRYPLTTPSAPSAAPRNAAEAVEPPASKARGFDAETSEELPQRRNAHQRVYANADGTETTEFSSAPVNYQRPDGSWAGIDSTLVFTGSGWRSGADSVDLRLAARADAPELVRLALDDQHALAYGMAGAQGVTGAPAGSTVTYPGVQPEVDLELKAQAGGVKETLVLHSADAAHRFLFPIRLTGLTADVVDDRIVLTDGSGVQRGVIPAGFMVDADGGTTDGVTYRLVSDGDAQAIEVSLNSAWLRDPARAFPVRADPTVVFAAAADESMVVQGNSSYINRDELLVGRQGSAGAAASYLRFGGLANQLRNHTIFGAQLQVVGFRAPSCSPRKVTVHPVTASWDADNDYAYPGPAVGPAMASQSFAYGYVGLGQAGSACPPRGTLFDLGVKGRDVVQGWVNGGANNGLSLRASSSDGQAWKEFAGTGTANPPRLYVTHTPYNAKYSIPKPVPDPAVLQNQSGKVKITVTNLSAQPWTPGAYYLAYRAYRLNDGTAAGQHRAADLSTTVARNGRVTFDATIKPLPPGRYFLDFTMVKSGGPVFTDQQVPPGRIVLEVFNIPPVLNELQPPNGYATPTLTPQLWAKATDIDAPPGSTLRYRFEFCERNAAGAQVNCVDSGFQASQAWTVPAGRLTWSKTYEWRASIRDNASDTVLGWQTMFSSVPQPEITSRIANAPYGSQERDFDPQLGNLTTAAVDAAVSNVGPPLRVVRTYNSLDPRRDLVFGAGWMTQFDMRLVPDDDGSGNVVITYPDGQQVRFGRNPDGTFAAPMGRTAQLTVLTGSGYKLLDRAGTSYDFDGAGRLRKISDAWLRSIVLSYDQSPTPRLIKAQVVPVPGATYGRAFTFGWTGNHITSVSTDPVGGRRLTWTYTYTGDLLTNVCAPDPAVCTGYTYATGSHYRSAVTDSGPASYWRLGEADGTAAGSEVANNLGKDAGIVKNVTLGVPGALTGTGNTAATFNGTTSQVELPKGTLKKNRDAAVELWLKISGIQTGGPLLGYQDKALDETADSGVPVLYVGLDGRVRGQFGAGAVSPITSTRDIRDDQWHHVVLSAMGNTQSLYLDGDLVGTRTGSIEHSALTFNQIGAAQATNPTTWPLWGSSAKRFFSGSIDEVASYAHPLGPLAVKAHRAQAGAAEQLTMVTLPSGKISSEAVYDTDRDRIKEYTDGNGGTWKIGAPAVYGGNRDLRRTVQVLDPADRQYLYEYDALAGRMLRTGSPVGLDTRAEDRPGYRAPTPTPSPSPTEVCTSPDPADSGFCTTIPDGSGGPVFTGNELDGMIIRSFGYNDQGQQSEITNENGDKVDLTYNNRGNITSRKTCRTATVCHTSYTSYPSTVTNPFDPRNDLPTETRDGRSASATDNSYRASYTYNDAGDLLTQTGPDNLPIRHLYTDGSGSSIGNPLNPPPPGLVHSTTDTRNAVTRYQYTRHGDLAVVVAPSGMRTEYTYDEMGRQTSAKETSDTYPAGIVTTTSYDDLNRPVTTTDPATTDEIDGTRHQTVTTTTYDVDGNVVREEIRDALADAPARVSTTEYDEFNRPTRMVDPEGNEKFEGYDWFGNRTSVIDANGNHYEYAYTARNSLAEVRLRDWRGDPTEGGAPAPVGDYVVLTSYAFDFAGRMVRQVDSMGRRLEYTYYKDDLLQKIVLKGFRNADGSTRDYETENNTYDGAGNLTRKVTGNGLSVTENVIDAMGRIRNTAIDPSGLDRRITYTYDAGGNVLRTQQSGATSNVPWPTSTIGNMVENVYDSAGRRTQEKVVSGTTALVTSYTFDQRGLPTTVTAPRGNVTGADRTAFTTTLRHDELGRQVSARAPPVAAESGGNPASVVNPTVNTAYDAFGQAVATRDALGNVRRTTYDRLGRPVMASQPVYAPPGVPVVPSAPTKKTSYDGLGNPVEVTDPRGNVTRFTYDRLNRVLTRDGPGGTNDERAVWRYTYTRTGEVLSATSPTGARTQTTYDDLDRPVTSTRVERHPVPDSFTTRYRYDDAGNLVETVLPSGARSTAAYNAAGQVVSNTSANGVRNQLGYDMHGSQVRLTDGLGRTTRTDFDGLGRVAQESDLNAGGVPLRSEKFEYDAAGNVTARVDALEKRATFEYDAHNRLVRQTESVAGSDTIVTSFGYDAAGNRTRYTDGRNNTTVYTVNSLGLPEAVIEPATAAHPNLADRTWTVGYNGNGNADRLAAPGGVVRIRTYDAAGRLTTEAGSGAAAANRGLGYDLAGRVTSVNAPGGTNTYTYNDRGDVLSAAGPSGNASYGYDRNGQLTSRTDAAGTSTFGYTGDRLSTMRDGASGVSQTLGYDAAGLLKTIDYGSGRVRTYGYDDIGRVSSDVLRNAGGSEIAKIAYQYDADDRLTVKETVGTATPGRNTYGYDDAGRLTSWTSPAGTVGYQWDDSGNRIAAGAKTASYDARNRLLSDGDYTYAYTPRGTLASRTSSGLAEEYSFDAFDRLVGQESQTYEYDGLDRVTARNGVEFTYAGFSPEVVADGTETYARGPSGELLAVGDGQDRRIALTDEHGDLIGAFDAGNTGLGGLAGSTAFDPFGQRIGDTGAQSNVGYQGDWTDPDTEQVNMGARWYSPGTGGFISRDSVSYAQGDSILANRYTYGAGNPMANSDPDGHWPSCGWCKRAASSVKNTVSSGWQAAVNSPLGQGTSWLARASWSNMKRIGSFAWGAVKSGWNALASGIKSIGSGLKNLYDKYAKPYIDRGKQLLQEQAAKAYQRAVRVRDSAVAAIAFTVKNSPVTKLVMASRPLIAGLGKLVVTAATQPAAFVSDLQNVVADTAKAAMDLYKAAVAVNNAVIGGISNALDTAGGFIVEHKAAIAGAVAGVVVGVGCGVAIGWTGVGAIGCAAAAGAVGSLVNDLVEGGKGWKEMGANALLAGAFGAVTGPLSTVAGSAVGAGVRAVIGGAGRSALSAMGTAATSTAKSFTNIRPGGLLGRATSGCRNSFVPGTAVLMADGTRKRIEDVQVSDRVLATDPTTGETGPRKVTDLIVGQGEKNLIEVTVDTDGAMGDRTASIQATDGHPFWVADLRIWVEAVDLQVGSLLRTSAGSHVQVTAVKRWTAQNQPVHNLTVDTVHTYYVIAGTRPVLVHNCDWASPSDLQPVHGISGDSSTKNVARLGKDMRAGTFDWEQSPLSVVRHEGTTYVLDGHHRLAAAKWVGAERVGIRDVTDELLNGGFRGYKDMADVLDTASRFQGNRLNPYKLR
ncbi:LamG-like jellyroll fold domain-containing protein [Plantactinospora soyae]|uniref:RHS repeat-associated protein n=1 Tax=Plantactinospora soyae TaxID=1544732 RepID=A0A927M8A4_9ACTN|nr:LamG-like jellyroll fold domain-containing protein [Plantactinospora soyae]MBE1488907.1 RHS repeat-associated protein [Plantactinospora soyae]